MPAAIPLLKTSLEKSISYPEYLNLLTELESRGLTSGPNQSEFYRLHGRLNLARMLELNQSTSLLPALLESIKLLQRPLVALVITEGWCGDAAQNLPLFYLMEMASSNWSFRLVFRDENPELMDNYLTNGGKSIPVVILLEQDTLAEVLVWGPRPKAAQVISEELKNNDATLDEKISKVTQWYKHDATRSLQLEWAHLFKDKINS